MEPRHPETGKPLSDLERILFRFRMVMHESHVMWRGFNAYPDVAQAINADLLFGLTNQALVIVCKFLEIWDDFGSLAKIDGRVIPTRKAVQPVIDRIKVWEGLELYRNTTLAHPYTTKSGELLPPWHLTQKELAPTYQAEQILLLQLITFATPGILTVFETEFRGIEPLCGPPDSAPGPGPGISHGTELDGVLRPIAALVDQNLQDHCGVVVKPEMVRQLRQAIGR